MTEPKPSPAWQGLRPTGKTLDNGQPEPGRPIIINCAQTNPENCHEPARPPVAQGQSPPCPGLCNACTHDFRLVLADVPLLLDDLDIAIAGETRFVEHGTRNGTNGNTNSGGNQAIAAYERLAAALMKTAHWFPYARHRDQSRYLARQLIRNIDHLVNQPQIGAIATDISNAASRAHKVIDAPPELWHYGPCPECERDLWQPRIGPKDPAPVKCRYPSCDYTAPLDVHNQRQLEASNNRWLTIDQLIGAITKGDEVITRKQIYRWRDHDGLPMETRSTADWVDGELVTREVEVFRLADIRAYADGEATDRTVTSRQAAERLGVTEDTIRKLAERKQLNPIRRGAKPLRFLLEEFYRYQQARHA